MWLTYLYITRVFDLPVGRLLDVTSIGAAEAVLRYSAGRRRIALPSERFTFSS